MSDDAADDTAGDSDAPDRATPAGPQSEWAGEACAKVAEEAERLNEDIQAVIDLDTQDRLLLRLLPDLIDKLRDMQQPEEPDRVRFAAGRGLIAVAERVGRAMRRDLAADKG